MENRKIAQNNNNNNNNEPIRMIINEVAVSAARRQFQLDCLRKVNKFFAELGVNQTWDDYRECIDTSRLDRGRIDHYFYESIGYSVQFIFRGGITYFFYPNDVKVKVQLTEHQDSKFYEDGKRFNIFDDSLYALASICVAYIRQTVAEIDRLEPQQGMWEKDPKKELKVNEVEVTNWFFQALKSERRVNRPNNLVFQNWTVYWSTPDRKVTCYSNCSGSCNNQCKGYTCYYYLKADERKNPKLPDAEQVDPRNVFDDRQYWLAGEFANFIQTNWFLR